MGETGESGLSKGTEFANELFGVEEASPEFQIRLRKSGSVLADAAGESREAKARLRFRPPITDPNGLSDFMEELGETESWKEFSPEFEQDLPTILKDLRTVSVQQEGFVDAEEESAQFSEDFERRFGELMHNTQDVSEKQEALTHLVRHLSPARRVRARSVRREWLTPAARFLADQGKEAILDQLHLPDRSQHAKTLRDSLIEAYELQPEELPDTTTPSLKALNERRKNQEFVPDRKDYDSNEEYQEARKAYHARQDKLKGILKPIAPLESRGVLSKMALLGHDPEISLEVAESFNLENFQQLLSGAEESIERFSVTNELRRSTDEEDVGADAGRLMMDSFIAVQDQVESLDEWYDLAERSIDFSNGGLESRVGNRKKLGNNLFKRLEGLEIEVLREWLDKDKTMELLSPDQSSDLLLKCLGDHAEPGRDVEYLAARVKELKDHYRLVDDHPVDYLEFRDKVAEHAQLQPSNVDTVFPEEVRGVTDINQVYRNHARSMSGVIAMARERSPEEQLATVEYLMGRLGCDASLSGRCFRGPSLRATGRNLGNHSPRPLGSGFSHSCDDRQQLFGWALRCFENRCW